MGKVFGYCLMVGRQILVLKVGVRLPVPEPFFSLENVKLWQSIYIKIRLFWLCWPPLYIKWRTTVAINNDPLMGAMFIMATLGLLGAYVTEFPILSGLYPNEVLHKVAVSSLLGIVFGLVLWAAFH